jgi:pentapeptide MXKDX repeat protein
MSHRIHFGLLALLVGAAAPLAAQQDRMHDEMKKDTMAQDGMGKDGMAKDGMGKDGMAKDAMGKDGMAMEHGMMMLPHGAFAGAEGHKAGGSFTLVREGDQTVLKLGDDFSAEKGPEVYLALSNGPKASTGAVFLGKLSKFSGAQVFAVPPGTDLKAFTHLVLWSKKDNVAFGTASLAAGDAMMHK